MSNLATHRRLNVWSSDWRIVAAVAGATYSVFLVRGRHAARHRTERLGRAPYRPGQRSRNRGDGLVALRVEVSVRAQSLKPCGWPTDGGRPPS